MSRPAPFSTRGERRRRNDRLDPRDLIPGRIVFTTSFGVEDQFITHSIFTQGLDIDVVTIDTGRLFPETYDLWERTEARYSRHIRAAYPQAAATEALVAEQGINGFYKSVVARKACCHVRKVEPLGRLLDGVSGWVTGLRADQSDARANVEIIAFDAAHRTLKINPVISPSAVRLARARLRREKTNAPAAGGGSRTTRKNADCMLRRTAH